MRKNKEQFNITIIRPQLGTRDGGGRYNSPARLEPLSLAILKALTPTEVSVKTIDDRFEDISFADQPDLVALSVCTFSAKRAYEIAAEFKSRNVLFDNYRCQRL